MVEVRLGTELKPRPSALARGSALLLVFSALGLMIFGIQDWYFPKAVGWWLALPFGLAGLLPAILFNRAVDEAPKPRLRERGGHWVMLLLLPCLVAGGFSVGAPSLVLWLLGPDQQVTATIIGREQQGSRSCSLKIVVARYSHRLDARFCVDRQEFDRLRGVRKIVIATREGYFGTLAFSLRPADEGPE